MSAPLKDILRRHIQLSGPLGLDTFMQTCLHHRPHGYYFRGQGIGRAGDFITAPEASPLFGQAVANWIRNEWEQLGQPTAWRLVELGPGRGTLMATILSHLPNPPDQLQMVEASPAFQRMITERLCDKNHQGRNHKDTNHKQMGHKIDFVEELGLLPASDLPTLLIANEYLDALPIRQFRRLDGQIYEMGVGWNEAENDLQFVHKSSATFPCPLPPSPKEREGYDGRGGHDEHDRQGESDEPHGTDGFWEVNLAAQMHTKFLCQEVANAGGAALLIDYGYADWPGTPTFQAIERHETVNPLANPGEADLTALVDFGTLSKIVSEQKLIPTLETQQKFLLRHGIDQMLETHRDQAAAAARLIRDDGMGTLFKALSFRACAP